MARMMLEASEGAAASGGAERAEGVLADTVVAAASAVDTAFDPVAYINTPRWQHSVLGLERVEAVSYTHLIHREEACRLTEKGYFFRG